ncbi:hypothetical protein BX600DRAFT_471228 [Xylariales sp. PMI_506]|nr:hypothetical protein BX600DRAFT_471228 [Xylariales sp. PMI_506]
MAEPSLAPAEAPAICTRCKQNTSAHDLRTEKVCTDCFKSFITAKTIKRLEVQQRETAKSSAVGGKPPPPPPAEKPLRYLLALSPASLSSTCLLSILCDNIRRQRERGSGRVKFELVVCVVDTSLAAGDGDEGSGGGGGGASLLVEEYESQFPDTRFVRVPVELVLGLDTVDWAALPGLAPPAEAVVEAEAEAGGSTTAAATTTTSPTRQLRDLLERRLASQAARADVLRLLVRHVLVDTARREACDVLLTGSNTTTLAELTLSEAAKGRGHALPWLINDGVFTLPKRGKRATTETATEGAGEADADGEDSSTTISIPIYHPLRELFRKELALYAELTQTPAAASTDDQQQQQTVATFLASFSGSAIAAANPLTAAVVSHKDLSIDEVMTRYFSEVEINYPSVVANVVRTAGKLRRSEAAAVDRCALCGTGLDEAGDKRWRGELGEPGPDVPDADHGSAEAGEGEAVGAAGRGRLCYGCDRSVNG